ncbi:MAG: hypothetical protein R3325_06935 [Thermoanaerobaculia bacterium]|nr:hypothetical protein [Thermoanaerobaculia bacterium]
MPDETPPETAAEQDVETRTGSAGDGAETASAVEDAGGPETPVERSPEGDGAAAEAAKKAAAAKAAAAKKADQPAREIPTEEDLARWIGGADLPSLSNLFNLLNTKLFDAKKALIMKEELLPQHWQVISALEPPPDEEFERLSEVERLRRRIADPEVRERRVEALKVGWQELRGKRPALWSASDLFGALRRIIDRKRKIDFHDFLSATRDVWRDLSLPHGREQLEVLWACLDLIRSKTKK